MASSVRRVLSFRLFPLVIMGIVILYLGASFARQASISHQRRQELRELETEITETKTENVDLQDGLEYMQSTEATEEWARKNGWAKQDEVSVVVVAPSADLPNNDTRGTLEGPKPSPNRELWWDLFFGER